jgi:cell division protein FtsZ
MGNRLAVTLISSLAANGEAAAKPLYERPAAVKPPQPAPVVEAKPEAPVAPQVEEDEEFVAEQESPEPLPLETPPQAVEAQIEEPERAELTPPPAEMQPTMIDPEPQQPRVILPKMKPVVLKEAKPVEKIVQAKQEVLQFESVTRGRFEKSEPTIVEGQDLDVPTFLRKNVRVK